MAARCAAGKKQEPGTRDQRPGTTDWGRLGLQEAGALLGRGQRAGAEAAPDAVTPAGNETVGEVTDGVRDEAQEACREGPGTGQLGEHDGDGGGAGEELLGWCGGGAEDEDGAGARCRIGCNGGCGGATLWDAHREAEFIAFPCPRIGTWGTRMIGVVGHGRREALADEQCGEGRRAGRRKAQAVVAIAGDEPLDRAIAEAAGAVVDDEQAGAESSGEVQRAESFWLDDAMRREDAAWRDRNAARSSHQGFGRLESSRRTTWPFHIHKPVRTMPGKKTYRVCGA